MSWVTHLSDVMALDDNFKKTQANRRLEQKEEVHYSATQSLKFILHKNQSIVTST